MLSLLRFSERPAEPPGKFSESEWHERAKLGSGTLDRECGVVSMSFQDSVVRAQPDADNWNSAGSAAAMMRTGYAH